MRFGDGARRPTSPHQKQEEELIQDIMLLSRIMRFAGWKCIGRVGAADTACRRACWKEIQNRKREILQELQSQGFSVNAQGEVQAAPGR